MEKVLKTLDVRQIIPYENNPRVNADAIEAVEESIRQCEYIAPIVVDEDHVILAGHTRYEALKRMQKKEIEVLMVSGLSEEQKKKYRLLDNKTGEFAQWDFDKLEQELDGLDFGDFDFDFDVSGTGMSYIDELMDNGFTGEGEKANEFSMTFTFPIEYEDDLTNYVNKNTKKPIVTAILNIVRGVVDA